MQIRKKGGGMKLKKNLLLWNYWANLNKMAAKLKIEKRGDEILIVHCCFSVGQNELKF